MALEITPQVPTSRTLTITSATPSAQDLSADRTWTINVYNGAGTSGVVPDPLSISSLAVRFLSSIAGGTWVTPVPITISDYGSFTNPNAFVIPDTSELRQPDALNLVGSESVTMLGTGNLTLFDRLNSPLTIHKSSFAPGSFTLRAGEYLLQYKQLNLTGNQQIILTEDAQIIMSDLVPGSSFVMTGS